MAKKYKRKKCQECGELKFIEKMTACPVCKRDMCEDCVDEYYGSCDNCIHSLVQAEIDLPRADIIVAARTAMKALKDVLDRVVYHG